MKAIIQLDVPDWQIGQEVSIYFPDTMMKKAICEKEQNEKETIKGVIMNINKLYLALQDADYIVEKMKSILDTNKKENLTDITLADVSNIGNTIRDLVGFIKEMELN